MANETSYVIDTGSTAFVIMGCELVLMMSIAGLVLLFGGDVRSGNLLQTSFIIFAVSAEVIILFALYGYSLSFTGQGSFLGGGTGFLLTNLGYYALDEGNMAVPESAYVVFQMMFAVITACLVAGSYMERMRVSASLIFTAFWFTLAYTPICYWICGPGGFLRKFGVVDFAGGLFVETLSGVSGLVVAVMIGPRRIHKHLVTASKQRSATRRASLSTASASSSSLPSSCSSPAFSSPTSVLTPSSSPNDTPKPVKVIVSRDNKNQVPSENSNPSCRNRRRALFVDLSMHTSSSLDHSKNLSYHLLGASLLWVGWCAFNSASAVTAGMQAGQALMNTQLATAAGILSNTSLTVLHRGHATMRSVVVGIICSLVGITPACGTVSGLGAIVIGATSPLMHWAWNKIEEKCECIETHCDDVLNSFSEHGLCGIWGTFLTGIFTLPKLGGMYIPTESALFPEASAEDIANGLLIVIQLLSILIVVLYAIVATAISCKVTDILLGGSVMDWRCEKMRVAPEHEDKGLDTSTMKESAYHHHVLHTHLSPHLSAASSSNLYLNGSIQSSLNDLQGFELTSRGVEPLKANDIKTGLEVIKEVEEEKTRGDREEGPIEF